MKVTFFSSFLLLHSDGILQSQQFSQSKQGHPPKKIIRIVDKIKLSLIIITFTIFSARTEIILFIQSQETFIYADHIIFASCLTFIELIHISCVALKIDILYI